MLPSAALPPRCLTVARRPQRTARPPLAILCAIGLLAVMLPSACSQPAGVRLVRLAELEAAPTAQVHPLARVLLSDASVLATPLYSPLCRRLGLLHVRNERDWEVLSRCATGLGACPDFARGLVVGLVTRVGQPLDGGWPVRIDAVQVFDGAALVSARFQSGTYLADGTSYLELVQVAGLQQVLVVEVNGVRLYPGEPQPSSR